MKNGLMDWNKRKTLHVILLACTVIATGCTGHSWEYPGVPQTAKILDDKNDICVFWNMEDSTTSPKTVSLWAYYKKKQRSEHILTTAPHSRVGWCKSDSVSKPFPKDSIPAISNANIISNSNEPLRLAVDGCPNVGFLWSFIVSVESDDAILLPSNGGFLQAPIYENILLYLSFDTYAEGGTYCLVDMYDYDGNLLIRFQANKHKDVQFDID